MLRLLLDEHISPAVAEGLPRRHEINAIPLADWQEGRFLGQSDETLLFEAAAEKLSLVSYDRRTIPPLLKAWAEAGRNHGGVIFVDEKTIPPSDIGGLIHALRELFHEAAKWDWANRAVFLRR